MQGRARGGFGREVRAIFFICNTLYQTNSHCLNVSRYSIGLPCYGLHKNSLRKSKGCNSKK